MHPVTNRDSNHHHHASENIVPHLSSVTQEQMLSSNVALFAQNRTLSKKPFTVFISYFMPIMENLENTELKEESKNCL